MDISFIKISHDKTIAQDLGESPHAKIRYNSQIQLLTKDPQPYQQITDSDKPLSVGNGYKVYVVRCDNSIEVDAGAHIVVTNRGNQLLIRFLYLPWDFYTTPVYLKISRGATFGESLYYSNKFLITRNNQEFTSRLDYKIDIEPTAGIGSLISNEFLASIRLQFYKNNDVDASDVNTYYQITTSQTVNQRVSKKYYIDWITNLMNAWTVRKLSEVLYQGKCYINQTRNYIMEGFEDLDREGMSNIFENNFLTDPDEKDKIKIIEVIIEPDFQSVPFLASSSQLASSSFLTSQSMISIPNP